MGAGQAEIRQVAKSNQEVKPPLTALEAVAMEACTINNKLLKARSFKMQGWPIHTYTQVVFTWEVSLEVVLEIITTLVHRALHQQGRVVVSVEGEEAVL